MMKKKFNVIIGLLLLIGALFSCQQKDISIKKILRGTFFQTIVETGELDAVNSKSFVMPRYGRYWYEMKIIGLLEHGTIVSIGDSLMCFDPSEIKKFIIERETQFENQKANLAKLNVELDNRRSDLESSLRSEEVAYPRWPIFEKSPAQITWLSSSVPSGKGIYFGMMNKEIPLVPAGAPSILASVRCTKFSQASCSPPEMNIFWPFTS